MDKSEVRGIIGEIREFCLHDGPGVRTTLFLKGCPLRCPWCHNPEFIRPGVETGVARYYTASEVAKLILRDRNILETSGGGVTFSGGEVLMQWEFASAIAGLLQGLHIAVETSGFASAAIYSSMLDQCDFIFQDIKCMDEELHKRLTGVGNRQILENLRLLQRSGRPYSIRMPYVPGFNDITGEVEALARFLSSAPGNLQKVEILPYHAGGVSKLKKMGVPVPPGLQAEDGTVPEVVKKILSEYGLP